MSASLSLVVSFYQYRLTLDSKRDTPYYVRAWWNVTPGTHTWHDFFIRCKVTLTADCMFPCVIILTSCSAFKVEGYSSFTCISSTTVINRKREYKAELCGKQKS